MGFFLWCATILLTHGLCRGAEQTYFLSNAAVQIGFGRAGELLHFSSSDGRNQLSAGDPSSGLWNVELKGENGVVNLSPKDARNFSMRRIRNRPPEAELRWSGFASRPEMAVVVNVQIVGDTSRWRIDVSGMPDSQLSEVRFPIISSVVAQPGETLAVPVWMGQQTSEARKLVAKRELSWFYPGILSMQCAALSVSNGAGLYTACDDARSFGKALAFSGGAGSELGFHWKHFPEKSQDARWALPYSVEIAPHKGNWFSAAERYRSWATNQVWAKQSRLVRGQIPHWVTNTALWVWNRGRSPGVLGPATVMRERLGLPVSVFWHWWHGCAYDAGFPEYLPPREGAEPFKAAVAAGQQKDLRAIVYMNQRLWGMETASWTNSGAARFAVKQQDGAIRPEVYNTFTKSPCASMCMGTEFWRGVYSDLAVRAVRELGVNGIYMDQACTSLACYDPSHGHTIGGGKYWMEGFQALAGNIRERSAHTGGSANAQVALAGEGTGESWLPHLDIMLSLQVSKERYAGSDPWETIPFFHAVYHPYFIPFGNYSSLTMPPYDDLWPMETAPSEPLKLLDAKYSKQFLLEQARAFVWGQQPTVANFLPQHLEQRPDEVAYVMRLAKVRANSREYLLHGTMLTPPQVTPHIEVIDFSRLSIYAGQQGGLREFQKQAGQVLAAAWRAPNGRMAVALASIAAEPLDVAVDPGFARNRSVRLTRVDESGRTRLPSQKGPKISMRLNPRDAFVLEMH